MNKLNDILAKLTGKTLAEQVSILTAELKGLFDKPEETAKTVTAADLSALGAKLDDLKAKLADENAALRAEASTAKAEKDAAVQEAADLKAVVAGNPAFAHAAAGHKGAAPGGGSTDGVQVNGTLVDQFRAAKTRTVNGVKLAALTAEAIRFFEKHQDAFQAAAHANHPMLAGLNPYGINAALTSTGTSTSGTGLAFTMVAIKTIRAFGAALVPFKAFSTDFSLEALVGTTVTSRVVPLSSGAGDLNDTYSGSYLGAAKTLTTTPITIDMTPHPIDGFSISPDQFSNIATGVWPQVAQMNLQQKMYSVATYCLKLAYNLITAANYGAAIESVLPQNIDNVFVGNLAAKLEPLGFQAGMMGLVLNSAGYAGLGNDPLISNYMASQMAVLRDGKVPEVRDFLILKSPTLPYAGTTPATEKLIGFANMPGGMCVAMRPGPMPPNPQLVPGLISAESAEDPVTGAILTIQQQIDPDTHQLVINVDNRFGCAVGDATQLKRIVSP